MRSSSRGPIPTIWRAPSPAPLVILSGVSHFAPVQDPAGFNAAMLGFLDQ
ncbi:alpha/beta hydrolase [Phenylobacterium aquaticum]|nr:alpha/beta hydrolase [Phenylobacterium aquaticum]MCI3134974.1 alpha/beta hydrolase [Phenylobacterium aquaticum]